MESQKMPTNRYRGCRNPLMANLDEQPLTKMARTATLSMRPTFIPLSLSNSSFPLNWHTYTQSIFMKSVVKFTVAFNSVSSSDALAQCPSVQVRFLPGVGVKVAFCSYSRSCRLEMLFQPTRTNSIVLLSFNTSANTPLLWEKVKYRHSFVLSLTVPTQPWALTTPMPGCTPSRLPALIIMCY